MISLPSAGHTGSITIIGSLPRPFSRREDVPPIAMATCLQKAISTQEAIVKEKHIRSVIIGTHQVSGASTFWDCVLRIPLRENPIVCWKFCHALHRVLREGHENVLRDSHRFIPLLQEHGRFWSQEKSGYGSLIKIYCNLLQVKLNFHFHNIRIPGNLEMDDQQLTQCGGDSDDAFFHISEEMLDYLDGILQLQKEILKTTESSSFNSMTNPGQCRLNPLITCIQDSVLLYDCVTKILFRLHSKVPAEILEGHRDRFLKVFHGLHRFYSKTLSLEYFKNVQMQSLPKLPPMFFTQTKTENYERRNLIDFNSENVTNSQNQNDTLPGVLDTDYIDGSLALVLEKQSIIEELRAQVESLKSDRLKLQVELVEARNQIRQLQNEKQELHVKFQEQGNKIKWDVGQR